MRAAVYNRYGGPEQVRVADLPRPEPGPGEVLVRVRAASVNSWDWDLLTGSLYGRMDGLFGPRKRVLGADLSGVVEAVGEGVTRFLPGDAVAGDVSSHGFGGFAEYVRAPEGAFVAKPDALSFEEAAAVPQAGLLALQALRKRRPIAAGERVLVIGGGGGCGSFAIQLAVMMGAEVTAIDHGSKLEFMRSLGAAHVIDYTREEALPATEPYDRILDPVARWPLAQYRRALKLNGTLVVIGGRARTLIAVGLASLRTRAEGQDLSLLIWRPTVGDMAYMLTLCGAGTIKAAIDKVYPLEQTGEALRRVGEGKSLGKVVVRVDEGRA
jgi:NADPH:quinone reductase-like Zn-dependent oxidoreductase